ncbi:hypothetical protein QBC37DRAFT_99713 [Rhypophila decipiens]|uniref:Uncharacterized protein n=1 Tax=Rhypophila decipiens TaxID=261697 RepID=A0AAN6XX71_9PEZI|nr:hypothetical protein QBC37DRAFT_99713 [Rhypophila decipiens]
MEIHSPASSLDRTGSSSGGPSPTAHTFFSGASASSASPPSMPAVPVKSSRTRRTSPTNGPSRGRGRPATAQRIWKQPVMQRRLIRLYLYTTESTLNTRQIGRLLSALANLEEEGKEREEEPTSLQSEIRSTQYQLSRLLSHGYHNLRPRTRETARDRISNFRTVRDGRIQKNKSARSKMALHSRRTSGSSTDSADTARNFDARLFRHDSVSSSRFSSPYSNGPQSLVDGRFPKPDPDTVMQDRQSIRLSWVRRVLKDASDSTPASSVCSEIRSLLSRYSFRSSLLSFHSSILASESLPDFPSGLGENDAERNRIVIQLCCQYRHDCLHRKVLLTVTPDTIPPALRGAGNVRITDLGSKYGRDKWNETALHLVARWAPEATVLKHLMDLLRRAHNSIINVRNIDGDTFMHVLAHRWRHQSNVDDTATFDGPQWAALVSEAHAKGYQFQSSNSRGLNFLASLLPDDETSILCTQSHQRIVFALWVLLDLHGGDQQILHDSLMTPAPEPRGFGHEFVGTQVVRFLRTQELAVARVVDEQEIYVPPQFVLQRYTWLLKDLPSTVSQPVISRLHGYLDCQTTASGPIASPEVFKELLEAGADPNDYNPQRQTCIMAVIDKMEKTILTEEVGTKLIEILINFGADLRLLDPEGNTALHYAVRARLPNVVQQLIKTGIPVHAENLNGETAPQIAVRQYEKTRPEQLESGVNYGRSQSLLVRLFDASKKK